MEYQDVIRDFALRTKKNLEYIESKASEDNFNPEVYEVTQLINSLIGLIVFPREEFINHIPETALSDLEEDGWSIPQVTGDFPQARDLRELVKYMRNAIAHFNVKFKYDKGTISGLTLWNKRYGKKTWQAELELEELRDIAFRFIGLIDDDYY
jgi:hypothetical protein